MKVLVTGGLGYIGSNVVLELAKAGFEPIIIDNLRNSDISVLDKLEKLTGIKDIPFIQHDLAYELRDKAILRWLTNKVGFTIHLAADKAVGESVNDPLKYYHNNLNCTINTLKFMQDIGCNKIVFSSSCTVYGESLKLPVDENEMIKSPLSPYGHTKIISEQIIEEYAKLKGIRAVFLRYFNPIGSDDNHLLGDNPNGIPNNLMPFINDVVRGKRDKLTIFGNDYPTPDGTCIRDYIHVTDLAQAHIKALFYDKSQVEAFNIGTGTGYSVKEIIDAYEEVNKVKINYEFGYRRDGDLAEIYGDCSKANKLLNWYPQKTLHDMVKSSYEFAINFK